MVLGVRKGVLFREVSEVLVRFLISEVARVVLGVGKGVLFREVSSVQECPLEREVPLYIA